MPTTIDITESLRRFLTPARNPVKTGIPDVTDGNFKPTRVANARDYKENEDKGGNVKQSTPEPVRAVRKEPVLLPDQAAWLPVARQILAGEFHGADKSTIESLTVGLRGIEHPTCQAALGRLRSLA